MNPYTALATQILREEIANNPKNSQITAMVPTHPMGEISKVSFSAKTAVKKATYLGILSMTYMVLKFMIGKFDQLTKNSKSEQLDDVKKFLPPIKKVLIPATVLTAIPVTLSMLGNDKFKTVSTLCYLSAAAFAAKELGPPVYKQISENIEARPPKKTEKQKIEERMAKRSIYLKHLSNK